VLPDPLPLAEMELVPEVVPLLLGPLPDPDPETLLKSEEEAGEPTELGNDETEKGLAEVVLRSEDNALDGCEEEVAAVVPELGCDELLLG